MALEMDMGTGGSSDSPEDWSLTGPNSKNLGFFTISFGCHFHELSVVRENTDGTRSDMEPLFNGG